VFVRLCVIQFTRYSPLAAQRLACLCYHSFFLLSRTFFIFLQNPFSVAVPRPRSCASLRYISRSFDFCQAFLCDFVKYFSHVK